MVPLMSLFLASTAALSSDEDVSHVLNHYSRRKLSDTYLEGGDGMACWEAKVLKDCSAAPFVQPTGNPTTTEMNVTALAPVVSSPWVSTSYYYPTTYKVNVVMTFPSALVINKPNSQSNEIIHANLHACKREIGICIPFVGKEPGLVTHTPAMCGNNPDGSPKACPTEYTVDLDPGKWNLIMHDRVKYCPAGSPSPCDNAIQLDFARGITIDVEEQIFLPGQCPNGYQLIGTKCFPCEPGQYAFNEVCVPANSLSYVEIPEANETNVKMCPTNTRIVVPSIEESYGSITMLAQQGASNVTQCRCDTGFYVLPDTKAWVDGCAPCPAGATCTGAEYGPIALPGYGEVTPGTNYFTECRAGDVSCLGGNIKTGTLDIAKGTFPATVTAYQCATGYVQNSSLCAACDKSLGYARQMEECNECTMGDFFYVFISILAVAVWFPTQRVLIMFYLKSLYTTTSFVQYLGFYSELRVDWSENLYALFRGFSFFNLNLESLQLSCANLSYVDIWWIQMLLPLVYPAGVVTKILIDYALYLSGNNALTRSLMKCGWVPERDFSFSVAKTQYIAPALYYINMYYYTGMTRSFEMLTCEDAGNGKQYLVTDPTITCWEGDHSALFVVALIGIFLYMVLLPLCFCYILLVVIPKYGQGNRNMRLKYGFLYYRFEPNVWYWELMEIFRKIGLCCVGVFGTRVTKANQSIMALACVILILLAELYHHPFRSALFDVLEETTTLCEVLVLILGIMTILAAAAPGQASAYDWVEPTVYILIGLTMALVVFCLMMDVAILRNKKGQNKLRVKKQLVLSPAVFNVDIHSQVLCAFVDQANDKQLEGFRTLEIAITSWLIRHRSAAKRVQFNRWSRMAMSEPRLISWVMRAAAKKMNGEAANPGAGPMAIGDMGSVIEHGAGKEYRFEPIIYEILTDAGRGVLLSWLGSAEASPEKLEKIKTLFTELGAFDVGRQQEIMGSPVQKVMQSMYAMQEKKQLKNYGAEMMATAMKATNQEDKAGLEGQDDQNRRRSMADDIAMQSRVIQHRDSSTNLGLALSRVAAAPPQSEVVESSESFANDGNSDGGPSRSSSSLPLRATKASSKVTPSPEDHDSAVMVLLDELRDQLNCDAVVLASKSFPTRSATNGVFQLADVDFALEGSTPAALAVSTKETVSVKNILIDERFDVNALNALSLSYLCVPFMDSGAIIALNKNHPISKSAIPFPSMDEPIIKLYASVLKDMDGDDSGPQP